MSKHPFYDDETIEAIEKLNKILDKMSIEEREILFEEIREMRKKERGKHE